MFTIHQPFLLHAVTSVHAGSGSELGNVDLPIQREKHTGYPKFESSSIKGALRHHMGPIAGENLEARAAFTIIFGSAPKDEEPNESQASAVSFLDARMLLFPIRSLKGTFVWITCLNVLQRFNREMKLLNPAGAADATLLELAGVTAGTASSEVPLITIEDNTKAVVLEEYTFITQECSHAKKLAEQLDGWMKEAVPIGITERLVILSDDEFSSFVKLSTEVNARIRVEDNGTVESGLWYEENVPPEAIFYSALLIGQARVSQKPDNENNKGNVTSIPQSAEQIQAYILNHFPAVFQLGGSHTIGKGIMRMIWLEGVKPNDK